MNCYFISSVQLLHFNLKEFFFPVPTVMLKEESVAWSLSNGVYKLLPLPSKITV